MSGNALDPALLGDAFLIALGCFCLAYVNLYMYVANNTVYM